MKLGAAIAISALIVIVLGIVGSLFMYVSTNDNANRYEANISRLDKASESELSTFTLKVQEQAQIPDMYTQDLQKVLRTYFEGRGKQDDTYVRSFVKQAMPNFSTKMYENLMITIDSGRNAFNNIQKKKIDVCSDYKEFQGKIMNSTFLSGKYPNANIDKLCQVVSDVRTKKAFETGVQETIKLR